MLRTPKRYSLYLYLGPKILLGLAGRRLQVSFDGSRLVFHGSRLVFHVFVMAPGLVFMMPGGFVSS